MPFNKSIKGALTGLDLHSAASSLRSDLLIEALNLFDVSNNATKGLVTRT